jgi:hypothetical protein
MKRCMLKAASNEDHSLNDLSRYFKDAPVCSTANTARNLLRSIAAERNACGSFELANLCMWCSVHVSTHGLAALDALERDFGTRTTRELGLILSEMRTNDRAARRRNALSRNT